MSSMSAEMSTTTATTPKTTIQDEECEELEPGSGSVHSGLTRPASSSSGNNHSGGAPTRQNPPNSLAIMPDCDEFGGGGGNRSKGTTVTYLGSSGEGGGSGTSWTGGLAVGCTTVFKAASGDYATTATSSIPLTTPSPGSVVGPNGTPLKSPASRLEHIKNWTISTYKCSRQTIYEKLGKSSRTVDTEIEGQIETLRDTQRKYSNILRLARALASHFYHVVQTQNSLGECFSELAHKSPELQEEFLYNAETQRKLCKNGEQLLAALNFFVSSVNTLCNKTMEDTIATVKQYEYARIEYDAYRSDLEYYALAPKTDVNIAKQKEMETLFNRQKAEFEKLRSDVQIKLKFLDENRVKVMHKQLLLFHNAISAYFSGNQQALDATIKQFSIKVKTPNAGTPSWIEQ